MTSQQKRWLVRGVVVLVIGAAALFAWQRFGPKEDEGMVSGNGRIEATEIDVAAKIAGRVKEILVREGDFVKAGQVVALMDTTSSRQSFGRPRLSWSRRGVTPRRPAVNWCSGKAKKWRRWRSSASGRPS